MKTTGMDLKVQRIRAKVTQQEIADQLGLSRSWVARQEWLDHPAPSAVARYEAGLRTFLEVREVA